MSFEYAIALTGGIATGKSSVVKIMLSLGYGVIDADKIAHEVLDKQRLVVADIFGDDITVDDRVDRKKLGAIVFGDREKLKALEAILHPLIYDEIERLSKEKDKLKKPYFIDIPLFFESPRYTKIAKTLVVYAPKEIQISRLMSRDNYTKDEALMRIESQMDIEAKRELATYLIDNSGSVDKLRDLSIDIKDKIERSI